MSNALQVANMIPARVRFWIYTVYAVGSVVASYLLAKGVFTADEMTLWTGIGAAVGATGASNVAAKRKGSQPAKNRQVRRASRKRGG